MYFVRTNSGVKIAVEDICQNGKQCVVFVHGWPLNRKIFEYQCDILPQYGFRCVSIDMRGFGQSDCPADGYNYNRMAMDLYACIKSLNVNNITLCGFSMGGAIAIRYMTLCKGFKVSKLCLLAAAAPCFTQRPGYPYGMSKQDVNEMISRIYHNRPKAVTDFGKNLFAIQHGPELESWFNDQSLIASGNGTIGCAEALRDEDLRGELKNICVKTGIFHGKQDKICPYEFAVQLNRGIENSKIYPFEYSGHCVFYDELDLFNEKFLGFLHS